MYCRRHLPAADSCRCQSADVKLFLRQPLVPFRARPIALTAPMRATTVREWFPGQEQHQPVRALGPKDSSLSSAGRPRRRRRWNRNLVRAWKRVERGEFLALELFPLGERLRQLLASVVIRLLHGLSGSKIT